MRIKMTLLLLATTTLLFSQKSKKEETVSWDVSNPGKEFNYKTHKFTTDEGTWMNLDVSPNGQTIVFDMLGDIYSIPISGGTATVLRSGIPFEVQLVLVQTAQKFRLPVMPAVVIISGR